MLYPKASTKATYSAKLENSWFLITRIISKENDTLLFLKKDQNVVLLYTVRI